MTEASVLYLSTALIQNRGGEVLLVRKRDTAIFMQPGGKIDPGETPRQTLIRELEEELGLSVGDPDLLHLGQFIAPAANEDSTIIKAHLFRVSAPDATRLSPSQEIAELAWANPRHTGLMALAPFTRNTVLPLAISG